MTREEFARYLREKNDVLRFLRDDISDLKDEYIRENCPYKVWDAVLVRDKVTSEERNLVIWRINVTPSGGFKYHLEQYDLTPAWLNKSEEIIEKVRITNRNGKKA